MHYLVLQAQHYSLVVATGGGIVTRSENWGILHQGIVVWIDPGRNRLWERLRLDFAQRPLLQKTDPGKAFEDLHKARQNFYKEADMHVSVGDENPEQVALNIIQILPSILIDPSDQGAQQTIES